VLTCECGACFEVEDALAGREVPCPDCRQPIAVPARAGAPPRTSALALASAVLALLGAFTVIGTLAAVVLGVLGLSHIRREPQRLCGAGFALFGIIGGTLLTGLSVFALSRHELFGMQGWMRERTMGGLIDTSGPLEVDTGAGWTIARPTERWGRVLGDRSEDPAVYGLQKNRDLLLMEVRRHAYVDVRVDPGNKHLAGVSDYHLVLWQEFGHDPNGAAPAASDDEPWFGKASPPRLLGARALAARGDVEGHEWDLVVRRGGQRWRFLIRVHRKVPPPGAPNPPFYVVRAYTPENRFQQNEGEMRRALDSFRIKAGN
jgi:hypothetical protein